MDKWLKNNLVVKILAFVLALMLWLVVNQERWMEPSRPIDLAQSNRIDRQIQRVPITPYLDSEDYVIVEMEQTVDVYLRGERSLLSGPINADSYEVYVDLRGYGTGKHHVPVQTRGFPKGIDVEVRPSVIDVTIEAKQIKEMQVVPEIVGKPKEGYAVGDPIVNPLRVQVKAAESQLDRVAFVKAFVNVEGATQNVKTAAALKVIDVNGNIIPLEVEPATAEITVPITHPFITVPLQLNLIGNPPSGYAVAKVETDIDKVSIFGPKDVVSGIEFYKGPDIDLSGLKTSQRLQLPIPKLEGLTDLLPDKVSVTIEIVPSEKLEIADLPVQIKGLAEGFKAVIDPSHAKLNLTLEGAPDLLKDITAADIQANLILSGLSQGTHDVPLEIILPKYIKLASPIPGTIRVNIQDSSRPTGEDTSKPDDTLPANADPDEPEDAPSTGSNP